MTIAVFYFLFSLYVCCTQNRKYMINTRRPEVWKKVLESMPNEFTSHQFLRMLRHFHPVGKHTYAADFLLRVPNVQRLSKGRWKKTDSKKQLEIPVAPQPAKAAQNPAFDVHQLEPVPLQEALAIVKAAGYKVMKQEWTEI